MKRQLAASYTIENSSLDVLYTHVLDNTKNMDKILHVIYKNI